MSPRTHVYPVFSRVRCRIGDVRVRARQVRIGHVVRHEFRHGVVPMYVVDLAQPVQLVTGQKTRRMLFWESQLEATVDHHFRAGRTPCLNA